MMSKRKFPEPAPDPPPAFALAPFEPPDAAPKLRNLFGFIIN